MIIFMLNMRSVYQKIGLPCTAYKLFVCVSLFHVIPLFMKYIQKMFDYLYSINNK